MQIKAENLAVGYEEKIIVDDFNATIKEGEITTIIGPNGCGKSTVLKAICRLLNYKSGSITLDGEEISKLDTRIVAQNIAILPQIHSVPPDFTVEELVSYGRMPHQKWYEAMSDDDDEIISWAMKSTNVEHMAKRSINSLSGGEKQRVWIATVLAQKPKVLFLDEPTTYLDISHQIEVMNLVKKLNRETGIGVVMVLHDISQALEVSHNIIAIKEGRIYNQGTPLEVINSKMLKEVYDVNGEIVFIKGRKHPIITFKGIDEYDEVESLEKAI